jgi:glycerol-3-phosphate acyltransferase PlsY
MRVFRDRRLFAGSQTIFAGGTGMDFVAGHAQDLIWICIGYALGCISPGYLLVRYHTGRDIRSFESGSTGSSNVARALGRSGFVATLLGDGAKGAIAIWAALHFGVSEWSAIGVMIAVVAGHIWPAPLGFRGGKGLATMAGALLVLDFRLMLTLGGIALALVLLGMGTASMLIGALVSPLQALLLGRPASEVAGLAALVLLVLFAHRDNIRGFFAARRSRKGLQA